VTRPVGGRDRRELIVREVGLLHDIVLEIATGE
jgi:hypothetical protein